MQVIGLTHRPTGFNGRRWYFVSKNGKRAETLFLVGGFFRTRREAGLTYRSQSMGELDRALDRRRKLQAQLDAANSAIAASLACKLGSDYLDRPDSTFFLSQISKLHPHSCEGRQDAGRASPRQPVRQPIRACGHARPNAVSGVRHPQWPAQMPHHALKPSIFQREHPCRAFLGRVRNHQCVGALDKTIISLPLIIQFLTVWRSKHGAGLGCQPLLREPPSRNCRYSSHEQDNGAHGWATCANNPAGGSFCGTKSLMAPGTL